VARSRSDDGGPHSSSRAASISPRCEGDGLPPGDFLTSRRRRKGKKLGSPPAPRPLLHPRNRPMCQTVHLKPLTSKRAV